MSNILRQQGRDLTSEAAKYAGGALIGGVVGGVVGNKAGNYWSKGELAELKAVSHEFMTRLKRQPRLYSLYVQIEQRIKTAAVLPDGPKKVKLQKTTLMLTQNFLSGLTDTDKRLYLKIQQLTDAVYSIQSNSIGMGVTLGGVIGLVLAGNLK